LPNSIKTWLKDHLPQSFVGIVEYHLEPARLDSWGGPFNGQCFRQLIFLDLAQSCRFEAIVETGTFRGSSTIFLAKNSGGAPVYTSEISLRYFALASRRLRSLRNVSLYNMDSRRFLAALPLPRETRTFFYLDAHWHKDLPLEDETEFIMRNFRSFVIMIDDFEVPGDPGYSFDDYGPGKRLSLSDFPFHTDNRIVSYRPGRPSSRESGIRRGCIILVSSDLKPQVDSVRSLAPIALNTNDGAIDAVE
jgi:hypothetical protein